MPAMVPGSYDALDMTIEPILLNCPYSTYLFEFTTSKEIPEGASISITFPTPAYSFPAYTDCGEITGLEDSSGADITCGTVGGNVVEVQNFAAITSGTEISIEVIGVLNPAATIGGDVFTVAVMDGVDTIETADITATATTLSGTFAIIDLNVQVAELLPRNQQVDAWFRLEMDPGEDLPVNSVMTVDFSTHFGNLFSSTASEVECYAFGGLTKLIECSVAGQFLTMKFGEKSDGTVPIEIYFFGLIRYSTGAATLTGFDATLEYEGVPIGNVGTFPDIDTEPSPTLIDTLSMDYYPRNEAEIANYEFTFELSETSITAEQYFLIRFPFDFDPNLFKYQIEAVSDQLEGYLTAQVIHRQVIVDGFYDMDVTEPITIRLFGIVNPNKVDITRTGSFGLALMEEDIAIEGKFDITGIIPLLAPNSIQFISLTSTLEEARYLDTFTMEFLPR